MSFPRYAKYKDSRLTWAGDIPSHWEVVPIRYVARLESGHTPSRQHPEYWENCTVPWFSLADVWQIREQGRTVIYETAEKISELGMANSAARLLPARTVMLSRTASVGFAAIMGVPMATTQDFANWVCGPRLTPDFLLHVFGAMRGEFNRLMYGSTHNTIYMPDIQAFRMPLPSREEQEAIVSFLEGETAKIDALVAEQERLIELLKEKRQAVISHAVTKGLNSNAPMKDSGIEWLGRIPAHWQLKRIKHVARAIIGLTYSPDDVVDDGTGTLVLRASNVQDGRIKLDDQVFVAAEIPPDLVTRTGDILICSRSGSRALIGKNALIDAASAGVTFGAFMTVLRSPHHQYLRCVLNSSLFEQHSGSFLTATINQLTVGVLNDMVVPFPPEDERAQITAFVSRESQKTDDLIREAITAIDLLCERRGALISAAATGKIDVREAAARSAA